MFFLKLDLVIDLCELLKVKLKNSRPYHAQSQVKMERSHGTRNKKLELDTKQENAKTIVI